MTQRPKYIRSIDSNYRRIFMIRTYAAPLIPTVYDHYDHALRYTLRPPFTLYGVPINSIVIFCPLWFLISLVLSFLFVPNLTEKKNFSQMSFDLTCIRCAG